MTKTLYDPEVERKGIEKGREIIAKKSDNILSINKDNRAVAYEFIFDTKYKIDTTKDAR